MLIAQPVLASQALRTCARTLTPWSCSSHPHSRARRSGASSPLPRGCRPAQLGRKEPNLSCPLAPSNSFLSEDSLEPTHPLIAPFWGSMLWRVALKVAAKREQHEPTSQAGFGRLSGAARWANLDGPRCTAQSAEIIQVQVVPEGWP